MHQAPVFLRLETCRADGMIGYRYSDLSAVQCLSDALYEFVQKIALLLVSSGTNAW